MLRNTITFLTARLISSSLARNNPIIFLACAWTVMMGILCLVSISMLPKVGISNADKYVHVTFHFVFVALWFYAGVVKKRPLLRLFLASVVYGLIIEFLQETLTTTRPADIYDVMANTIGAALAVLLLSYRNTNGSFKKA